MRIISRPYHHQVVLVLVALVSVLRESAWIRRITPCSSCKYFIAEAFVVQPRAAVSGCSSSYNSLLLLVISEADHSAAVAAGVARSFLTKPLYESATLRTTGLDNGDENNSVQVNNRETLKDQEETRRNANQMYISTLENNLDRVLDSWMLNGNRDLQSRVENIYQLIRREAMDKEQINRAERLIKRSGMPFVVPTANSTTMLSTYLNDTFMWNGTSESRIHFAKQRQQWEESNRPAQNTDDATQSRLLSPNKQSSLSDDNSSTGNPVTRSGDDESWNMMLALLQKYHRDHRHSNVPLDYAANPKLAKWVQEQRLAYSTIKLDGTLQQQSSQQTRMRIDALEALQFTWNNNVSKSAAATMNEQSRTAAAKTSEMVAKAGGGDVFKGESLGIGGLDDVLLQVKRRIWVPLAAPPLLLNELGINPVRGLLLYGMPGCGKTLLAKKLGQILSPTRPITIVSGPEIMDKFVGSSEANLRRIFDNPPEIYPHIKEAFHEDDLESISKAALHVIVMDEFDAIARQRGGRGGKGDQGDAGVARDSLVNQLLAKMDGVDELIVPTLVIGLTNRRSLIEPALLRPGRFEVQIEVPPPQTVAQRTSILKVHTSRMYTAGRMLVRDAPQGTAAFMRLQKNGLKGIPTYDELVDQLATECVGMSGAMLAGVCRAAASRALERAVCDFASGQGMQGSSINTSGGVCEEEGASIADCLITVADFQGAMIDVNESCKTMGDTVGDSSFVEPEKDRTASNV